MPKKSAFIVFEGLDGSGLTTHSRALEEWLQRQGYSVIWQDEPTPGVIGHLIREIMQSDVRIQGRQDLLALLFAADRIWHIKQPREDRDDKKRVGIERALREGNIVICNRYLLS